MDRATLQALNAARAGRRAAVVFTDLETDRSVLCVEGERCADEWIDAMTAALRSGKPGMIMAGGRSLFLNVYLPPPRILVVGAVHISQALARMAAIAGFDLTILDPRTAFATAERFSGVELIAEWPEDVLTARPLDRFTAVVAVTHDPKIDDEPIRAALTAGCFYVGALGSRKTHASRVERLRRLGVSDDALAQIKAPIGLDIGAASPAEIAVAILAEIIEALRRRHILSGSEAHR
ncbi:XdhC family protein [Ensifer sp. HO-A22]|uniref:XdhC family protein n=1 Tax=Ensifer oleiphilus TaxID=2742698 RepID=A0A7Y6Q4B2_9HYPH|nr:XdhC family protein [Ensifer oleiphilus]NVD38620.1 XdhC family protein [Ensifer oleiphilus]